MLIVQSWFHMSTPLGIEPESCMTGGKRADFWTSGTVYECSEIAGSAQNPGMSTISMVWKETQREVRHHWFIYSYISAYKQALYMYCLELLEYIRLV